MSVRFNISVGLVLLVASVVSAEERLYWTSEDGFIRRISVGVPQILTLELQGGSAPRSIKVDRCAGTMFWADSEDEQLLRANTAGWNLDNMTTSVVPIKVAVDPIEQKVYFVDGSGMELKRAGHDAAGAFGESLSEDWVDGALWGGVTINTMQGKLYGCGVSCTSSNECHGYIWRANLSGNLFEIVLTLELDSYASYPAVDPYAGKIYWSESFTNRIRRANLDGTQLESHTTANETAWLSVDPIAGRIYWSEIDATSGPRIMRAFLDFSDVEPVIENLPSPVTGLDIEGPAVDSDLNGIDDRCTAPVPPPPTPESGGISKSRFISFQVQDGRDTALRVRLMSLHHVHPPYSGGPSVPFSAFEGESRWVGMPFAYRESSVSPEIRFYASRLLCEPTYADWSSASLLHVTGNAVVPSSTYSVENLAISCKGQESTCPTVSSPAILQTARWGDVAAHQNPPHNSVQPDIADVSAVVDKFRNVPDSLTKSQALLAGMSGNVHGEISGNQMWFDIDFSHISACVDAFRGAPYPYVIDECP